jgi:hypothetical protein
VTDFPLSFTADSLVAEARERTGGLEDFGPGPFVEPLGIFVDSLRHDAMLNPTGVHIAKTVAMGHIVNRLTYGSTILHDILAQDPSNRSPLTWEVMFPSPPPQTATFETDPRIATCGPMHNQG